MSLPVLLVALAMARPIEVLEQWELVSDAPLREGVTARGLYHQIDGPDALLPEALQGPERPTAYAVGGRDLVVRRAREGWVVALPASDRQNVRVVGRVVRDVPGGAVLFRVAWPRPPMATTPTRRVAEVDRAWLPPTGASPEWTCAGDDDVPIVPCVSSARAPSPLIVWLPAARASRAGLAAAALALLGVLGAVFLMGTPARRRARFGGALGGALCGLSVALALVGAHALGAATAVALATPTLAALGALATRTPGSRAVGAIALLALPLLVVADGRLRDVLLACAIGVPAIALLASLGPRGTPAVASEPAS